jgi:hypothetical protein
MRRGSVGGVPQLAQPSINFESDPFCPLSNLQQTDSHREDEVSTAIDAHEQHSVISSHWDGVGGGGGRPPNLETKNITSINNSSSGFHEEAKNPLIIS